MIEANPRSLVRKDLRTLNNFKTRYRQIAFSGNVQKCWEIEFVIRNDRSSRLEPGLFRLLKIIPMGIQCLYNETFRREFSMLSLTKYQSRISLYISVYGPRTFRNYQIF